MKEPDIRKANTGGMKREQSKTELQKQAEEEKRSLFLLNEIEGMHHGLLKKMYEFAGSFADAYRMPAAEWELRGFLRNSAEGQKLRLAYDRRREREELLMREYEQFPREGIRLVSIFDEAYPKRLSALSERPFLLYVRGKLPAAERPAASIIGARMCSEYGRSVAEYFGKTLSEAGVQIISGMALGIDGAAQRAALLSAGESFAVLGSGVDVCYPRENRGIYQKMCDGAGGVISEYPRKSAALPYHFILRNRIIAGLCDALLVLEAREKSGTAATVSYALDMGREIFALPGRINDPLGRGCNALLKDGASVLTSPEDVLEFFDLKAPFTKNSAEKKISTLAKPEKIVYSCLDSQEQHMERIAEKAGMSIREAADALLSLELKGLSASPMSGYYRKI